MNPIFCKLALGLCLILSLGAPGMAQNLSVEDMVKQLQPTSNTRSLLPSRGIAVEGGGVSGSPSVNLYVNFAYNSSELTQDSLITLDRLAEAIGDARLAGFDFLVAGHTDAKGGEAYNLELSERRARSVRDYLANRGGVSATRLFEKGFGESHLLNADDPLNGVNRRVQIITLSRLQ